MLAHCLAIIYMIVLALLSLTSRYPEGIVSIVETFSDMVLHGLAYLILALLISWARSITHLKGIIIVIAFSSIYGLILELIQLAIPERSFSITDLTMNSIGASIGAFAYAFVRTKLLLIKAN